MSENGVKFWRRFGPFSRLFSDFRGPGRLFQDFLAFGAETPSPRSTEPQRYCFKGAALGRCWLSSGTGFAEFHAEPVESSLANRLLAEEELRESNKIGT